MGKILLGNTVAWIVPDQVQAGLYLVVAADSFSDGSDSPSDPGTEGSPPAGSQDPGFGFDHSNAVSPTVPKTGDPSRPAVFFWWMAASGGPFFCLQQGAKRNAPPEHGSLSFFCRPVRPALWTKSPFYSRVFLSGV